MAIKVLWADQEHMWAWREALEHLERRHGFEIKRLHCINHAEVVRGCRGKQVLVIHCGTLKPMAYMRKLLQDIKSHYPNIKVGLETNCNHPDIEDFVDFYVEKPLGLDELEEILRDAIK